MSKPEQVNKQSERSETTIPVKTTHGADPIPLMPEGFDADYVTGCIAPFLNGATYIAETPLLPMIDLALSKEKGVNAFLWGILYEGWSPNPEVEGLTVFTQGYENRGPRKMDTTGMTVMPGLLDCHVHLTGRESGDRMTELLQNIED